MLAAGGARLYKTQTFTSAFNGLGAAALKPVDEADLQPSGEDSSKRVHPGGASSLRGDSQ